MTVTTTTARKDYTGNGSTTDYTFDFKTFSDSDVVVETVVQSTGVITTQVLNTDYTITRTSEGGTVSFVTAPASTVDIVITRNLDNALQQSNAFVAGTALSSQGLETVLDKIVAAIHDLREDVNRCIKVPTNQDYNTNLTLPEGFNSAGYGIVVNSGADGFDTVNISASETGISTVEEDTSPSLGGNLNGQGYSVSNITLKTYNETHNSASSSSGTLTLDLSTGRSFAVTLTENVTTVTISNPPSSGVSAGFKIFLTQDATARTITWPASVIWDGGAEPAITTTNSKHLILFETFDGGTTWYGSQALANLS